MEASGSMSIGGFVGGAYHISPSQSGFAIGVGNHVASVTMTNDSIQIHIGFLD